MTGKTTVGALALGWACAGCVPMEQASLTYTSKSTIGVGVAAGTPDTPGLDVTIGFKELNAAFVPVAVAKYCYKATEDRCQNLIYKMRLIEGGKLDTVENRNLQLQIESLDADLTSLNVKQIADANHLAELKSKIFLANSANDAVKELNSLEAAEQLRLGALDLADQDATSADALAREADQRRTALGVKIAAMPADFDLKEGIKEATIIEGQMNGRAARIALLQQSRDALSAQLRPNTSGRRTDSFSVYGKFNGNAEGKGKAGGQTAGGEVGAGLTAGKVFATGIAAQNLTEFTAVSDCLANIRALAALLTPPADAAALINSAPETCGTTRSSK